MSALVCRILALVALVVSTGCANSVEYAAPAEEVIIRADGSPYRALIEDFAVSRDGQFIAFRARGDAFGLDEVGRAIIVYDRRSRSVRGTCPDRAIPGFGDWELSEDGRYVMVRGRRCDLATGEVVELGFFGESAYYGTIAFFKDGSGVAYHDSSIPGVRVAYYDGRPDVEIPLDLPGTAPSGDRELVFIASDRWGRQLLVSGYYHGDRREWHELGAEGCLVTLPEGTTRRVEGPGLVPSWVESHAGFFSDDGSILSFYLERDGSTGLHRFDVATWEELPWSGAWSISDELDDGRVISTVPYERGRSVFGIPNCGGVLAVLDGEGDENQLLRADLSAFLPPPYFDLLPYPALVVAAPESHEVFLSFPLFEREDETGGLVVVPVPPREVP